MQGRIALVTGGGTGIGAACARRFVESGASVTVMGRRADPIRQIAQANDGLAVQGDAAVEADCIRAVSETIEAYGGLDTLICCAGIMIEGSVTDMGIIGDA